MMSLSTKHKVCVIVPTYNNHRTLATVLDGVLGYTTNIIVVNDGSTDTTSDILALYPDIVRIDFDKNQGKGMALRIGFAKSLELGFTHAITIDSDGQHFASDIPAFIERLDDSDGNILIIGSRNMTQEGVPKKSSFGNKFSNFWFKFETGIKLEDTQSGYRLYPLTLMPKKYFTRKFEFEIESIVRAAWKGIEVVNMPIKVHYDLHDRVSHFRPFKDFSRISVLNTVLVIITLLYIKPRNSIRNLRKKNFKKFVKEEILESGDSPARKASSIALGVLFGLLPIWGFQMVGVISAAYVLRLNKLLAFTFSNVSLPPFIPFIIYFSLQIGSFFVGEPIGSIAGTDLSMEFVKNHFLQYLIGSTVVALTVAAFFGISSYGLIVYWNKFKTANV